MENSKYGGSLKNLKQSYLDERIDRTLWFNVGDTFKRDTYTPMFIAALITMVKTWKQHKCALTKEWIKKMWCISYTMEYYSDITKNEIRPFATTWMDLESVILSEVSQKETEISYDIPYTWNLKRKDTNELTKQKQTHRLRKPTHGCWGEGIVKDFEGHVHTAKFKMDNKNLLYSTWNSAQCYVAAWMGRGFEG